MSGELYIADGVFMSLCTDVHFVLVHTQEHDRCIGVHSLHSLETSNQSLLLQGGWKHCIHSDAEGRGAISFPRRLLLVSTELSAV